jgi:hypothetical protein
MIPTEDSLAKTGMDNNERLDDVTNDEFYDDELEDGEDGEIIEEDDIFALGVDNTFPEGHRISDSGSISDSSDMSDGLDLDDEDDLDYLLDDFDSQSSNGSLNNEPSMRFAKKSDFKKSPRKAESARDVTERMIPLCFPSLFPDSKLTIDFSKCNKSEIPPSLAKHMIWRCTRSTPTIIRDLAQESGFTIKEKGASWVAYWGKYPLGDRFKKLSAFQRINHFPASFHLGRKDSLCNNLMKMKRSFGKKVRLFILTILSVTLEHRKLTFIQLLSSCLGIWAS